MPRRADTHITRVFRAHTLHRCALTYARTCVRTWLCLISRVMLFSRVGGMSFRPFSLPLFLHSLSLSFSPPHSRVFLFSRIRVCKCIRLSGARRAMSRCTFPFLYTCTRVCTPTLPHSRVPCPSCCSYASALCRKNYIANATSR